MAAELQQDYISGKVVYFLIRDATGSIWNGAALVTYNSANYSGYAVTGTEQGTSGYFTGDMPVLAVGSYNVLAKERAGGSPAETDITIGTGQIDWALTKVASLTSVILSDNVAHGGFGASLVLQQALIVNPAGNALTLNSTGGKDLSLAGSGSIWDSVNNQLVSVLVNSTAAAALVAIAQSVLKEDVGNVEVSAPVHSLAVAILKLVSKFDAKLGTVYQTDGVTAKMTQSVTTDVTMVPIRSLGVGT